MIYVRLSGRIGNYLFQIAAGATLAKRSGTAFKALIASDDVAIAADTNESMKSYISQFQATIFRNVDFVDSVPSNVPVFSWYSLKYQPFPAVYGDLLIEGYFQSHLYIDYSLVKALFAMPDVIEQSLNSKYSEWINRPFVCINVRRGDFLKLPHRFTICSKSYFKKAMNLIGRDSLFVCVSDDIPWCKRHIKGANIYYADKNKTILEDLYVQTFAQHNIMSNSSFSWWGAFLNFHEGKTVYYPKPWFGPHNSWQDTSNLCPTEWIALENSTPLYYKVKSIFIRLKLKFSSAFV